MCGIAGFYGSFKQSLLDDMNLAQSHRGPDNYSTWYDMKTWASPIEINP